MKGDGMVAAGTSTGRYAHTDYRASKLRSTQARNRHKLNIYLHTDQSETIDKWLQDLNGLVTEADASEQDAWERQST
jgi:hypothetical protein